MGEAERVTLPMIFSPCSSVVAVAVADLRREKILFIALKRLWKICTTERQYDWQSPETSLAQIAKVSATAKYPACPSGEYPSPSCNHACSESGYSGSYSSDKQKASSAYSVRGEDQIMQELVTNGPMYVAFTVYSDFPTYKSGVYKHTTSSYLGGHAVTLV